MMRFTLRSKMMRRFKPWFVNYDAKMAGFWFLRIEW